MNEFKNVVVKSAVEEITVAVARQIPKPGPIPNAPKMSGMPSCSLTDWPTLSEISPSPKPIYSEVLSQGVEATPTNISLHKSINSVEKAKNLRKDKPIKSADSGNKHVWTKGPKRKPCIGNLPQNETGLQSIRKPIHIFATRFAPDTAIETIEKYIKSKFKEANEVECYKLNTKFDSYTSFRISLCGVSYKDIFSLQKWPSGILVKKFYFAKKNCFVTTDTDDSGDSDKSKLNES